MPCRTWWPHRCAAGEHTRRHCQWPARRPLHHRRTWTGCDAGGRRQSPRGHGMKDFTPNIPEIVAEVRELFERYEAAIEAKDVAVLEAPFWNSPHTIRYALHENGYGFEAIHKHRVARPPGPGIKEHRIRPEILTLGRDLATVHPAVKGR